MLWIRLAVTNISALIPSAKDGWHIAGGDYSSPSPTLVHLSNVDGTSLIILNAVNGDMWWYQAVDGKFQETDMRVAQKDGSTLLIDPAVLHGIYGTLADIPLYVLNSIVVTPPATPVPPPPTRRQRRAGSGSGLTVSAVRAQGSAQGSGLRAQG